MKSPLLAALLGAAGACVVLVLLLTSAREDGTAQELNPAAHPGDVHSDPAQGSGGATTPVGPASASPAAPGQATADAPPAKAPARTIDSARELFAKGRPQEGIALLEELLANASGLRRHQTQTKLIAAMLAHAAPKDALGYFGRYMADAARHTPFPKGRKNLFKYSLFNGNLCVLPPPTAGHDFKSGYVMGRRFMGASYAEPNGLGNVLLAVLERVRTLRAEAQSQERLPEARRVQWEAFTEFLELNRMLALQLEKDRDARARIQAFTDKYASSTDADVRAWRDWMMKILAVRR